MEALEWLNHAGFIEFSTARPLARTRTRVIARKEEEEEKENPLPPFDAATATRKPRRRKGETEKLTDEQLEERKRVERDMRRTELINDAERLAADWDGKDSEAFDAALAELEQRHRVKLPFQVRERLWDSVFGPTPAV